MKVHKPITPKIFDAWRAADFDLQEITDWTEEGVNLRHAIAWQDAGFYPNGGPYDEHDVCGWLKWDCTPEQAVEYLHQGCEEAPWDGFKKLGISLDDAVFLQLNGIDDEYLEKHMEVYEQITPKIFNAWRAADFGFDEIIDWTEEGVNLRDAIVWRDAGFYPEGGGCVRW